MDKDTWSLEGAYTKSLDIYWELIQYITYGSIRVLCRNVSFYEKGGYKAKWRNFLDNTEVPNKKYGMKNHSYSIFTDLDITQYVTWIHYKRVSTLILRRYI